MQLANSQLGQAPMITVDGECDHANTEALRTAVAEALAADTDAVLIDLEKCTYIDSGGISILLGAVRRMRGRGWLGVLAPNENIRRLFKIVGLTVDPGFRIFADRDEASQALETSRAPEASRALKSPQG